MVITAKLLDRNGENRSFSLIHDKLELGFHLLNKFISDGDTLLGVAVLEGTVWTHLSVESFDGQPCLEAIDQLVNQYQRILALPLRSQSLIDKQMALRINHYGTRIGQLENAVSSIEQGLQRVQDTIQREPLRTQTLEQLQHTLDRFQRSLRFERASLQRLTEVFT